MSAEARNPMRLATEINRDVPVAHAGEFASLHIGRDPAHALEIWPPVVLAPMAGVTNYPFRSLCREYGAGLFVSEMITARGFLLGNRITRLLADAPPDERPRSIQVYGSDPVDVGEMVKALVAEGIDHIDINLGCPVPKVTRQGGGSAIPYKPKLVARLVRAMVANAAGVPVTIKMRTGLDEGLLTYIDAAKAAEGEGVSAIGLHARTAAMLYSGLADWSHIKRLKESVSVPVLGNGDIWECFDALRMMRETGCDGVIVGRACLGRPWLFAELVDVFEGREARTPPCLGEIREIMLDHAGRLVDFFGVHMGIRQFRKWTSWYVKGFFRSARLRGRLHDIETMQQLQEILAELDPDEPFPERALRVHRAKGSKRQRVKLPEGYLDERDDDTPPRGPRTTAEIAAWERALSGG